MFRRSLTLSNTGQTDPIRVDSFSTDFKVGLLAEIASTATVTVEYTVDIPDVDPYTAAADNWANATWIDITDLTGATATADALLDTPVQAVRLDCTAHTAGDVTLTVTQGGPK